MLKFVLQALQIILLIASTVLFRQFWLCIKKHPNAKLEIHEKYLTDRLHAIMANFIALAALGILQIFLS